jgi:serine phosphatase RsbU (regulator of sigma subunit)
VSTNRGLSCFDPGDGSFRNIDARDGLQSNEFNAGAQFAGGGGELFFGGIRGLNLFRPEEIGLNSVVPAVVITDLQLFNRSIVSGERVGGHVPLARPIEYADAVELSHRDSVVTLEFAALHFTAPEKNRYAYALEGFTEGWIAARPDRRSATFTGLPPGRYRFRVKAANADGVWNEQGASLLVTVAPPLWATWWFRGGSLLAVAALFTLAYRRRLRNVRLRAELATAHEAQMAIMPRQDPAVAGFEISGACVPAHEVGGDFFDYLTLPAGDGRFCIEVGDISGKAMRAAMTAVMASGMVATQAESSGSLAEIATRVNRTLHRKAERPMFAAVCLVALDGERRALRFVNAGLCPPLLRQGGEVRELEGAGPRLPLGALRDTAYLESRVALAVGDVLLLHSDGVPEATDAAGQPFGYERLAALLAHLDTAALSAREITRAVLDEVARFTAGSHLRDDVAVVAVKVRDARAAGPDDAARQPMPQRAVPYTSAT